MHNAKQWKSNFWYQFYRWPQSLSDWTVIVSAVPVLLFHYVSECIIRVCEVHFFLLKFSMWEHYSHSLYYKMVQNASCFICMYYNQSKNIFLFMRLVSWVTSDDYKRTARCCVSALSTVARQHWCLWTPLKLKPYSLRVKDFSVTSALI